VEKSQ